MTSNVGSQLIQELQGVDEAEMRRGVEAELRHRFRPEFLNRIDDVIVFRRLALDEIEKIVDIQLRRVAAPRRAAGRDARVDRRAPAGSSPSGPSTPSTARAR